MKVVLDTNILVAALISNKGVPRKIYRAWLDGRYTLVTSSWQIEEFRRVSRYERMRPYIVPSEVGDVVNGLRARATVVGKLPKLELSPDPDDNFVLATAIRGEAAYLVTGDRKDLLVLEKLPGLRIIKARGFFEVLRLPADYGEG